MMKSLSLTDNDCQTLLDMLKKVLKKYHIELAEDVSGAIEIFGKYDRAFILDYKYSSRSKVFNFRDKVTNYSLFRVNLNKSFHKNADGKRISGNRINIFSEKEYWDKKDGFTYYKAFSLPYETIRNTGDFFETFEDIFIFSNTDANSKINIQGKLIGAREASSDD